MKAQRIVLPCAQPDRIRVQHDITYKQAGDLALKADLYLPPDLPAGSRVPAVIFVHGDAPWEILHDAKDWGQYRSWAELAAESGLAAVTFTHRSTERLSRVAEATSDVVDLVAYVRAHAAELSIDAERLGLWVCSAGGPVGLPPLLNGQTGPMRCAAALYALLEIPAGRIPEGMAAASMRPFSAVAALEEGRGWDPALLVVRVGQDHPDFTQSADRFAAAALTRNLELELINYPAGRHAFDLLNDDDQSRRVIRRVIAFFQERLA